MSPSQMRSTGLAMSGRVARSRTHHPAQGSCRQCRDRRIRCDGGHPSCHNCVRRGSKCAGYSTWEMRIDSSDVPSATYDQLAVRDPSTWVALKNSGPDPMLFPPLQLTNLEIDDSARNAFDYFRYRAYESYGQRGYPILWADCALAIALNEPAVFYALAASGAAEQALTHSVHATLVRPANRFRGDLAIDLYSRALRHLQVPMRKAIAEDGSLMPVILSCLVFVIYETTFGTHLDALRHARTGFNILDERLHRSNPSHTTLLNPEGAARDRRDRELCCTDTNDRRLSPRTGIYKKPASFEISRASTDGLQTQLEALTEAGQDVRSSLQALAQQLTSETLEALSEAGSCCIIQTISRVVPINARLRDHMSSTLSSFRNLSQQLRLLLLSTENICLHPELLFMQIRCFHASFSLAMSRGFNEQLTDYFADDISRALENCERLVRLSFMARQGSTDDKKATGPIADEFMQKLFAAEHPGSVDASATIVPQGPLAPAERRDRYIAGIFEFGILPALYLIACKCRTSSHRRRAARLLREANRVEAINSSHTLAAYADAIIDLEEQATASLKHCDNIQQTSAVSAGFYADEVPKEARFLDVVAAAGIAAHGGEESSTVKLTCTRMIEDQGNKLELLEYHYDCTTKLYSASQLEVFAWQGGALRRTASEPLQMV